MTTPIEYFEARWAETMPTLPLVTPTNMHVDLSALPDQWAGVLVNSETFRSLTMGSKPWREEIGTFVVGVFTRSGTGFTDADQLSRSIANAFLDWRSSDMALSIPSVSGPLDIDPEADGEWFRLSLELSYQMWSQAT